MLIEVYICPTPGCGDYYGAAGMGDLGAKENLISDMCHTVKSDPFAHPEVVSTRDMCQSCRSRGVDSHRVLCSFQINESDLAPYAADAA